MPKISISLMEVHIEAVKRHQERIGLTGDRGFSTALQSMIVKFDQQQQETAYEKRVTSTPVLLSNNEIDNSDQHPEAETTAAQPKNRIPAQVTG